MWSLSTPRATGKPLCSDPSPSQHPMVRALTRGLCSPGARETSTDHARRRVVYVCVCVCVCVVRLCRRCHTPDTFAPTFSQGYPNVTSVDDFEFTLAVKMEEPGNVFFVAHPLAGAATVPPTMTGAQVKAGLSPATVGGTRLLASATAAVAGSMVVPVAKGLVLEQVTAGLEADMWYALYVVPEDTQSPPNLEPTPVVLKFRTLPGACSGCGLWFCVPCMPRAVHGACPCSVSFAAWLSAWSLLCRTNRASFEFVGCSSHVCRVATCAPCVLLCVGAVRPVPCHTPPLHPRQITPPLCSWVFPPSLAQSCPSTPVSTSACTWTSRGSCTTSPWPQTRRT